MRHLPDRTLHPVRRWRQLRRLRKLRLPRGVVFICHGNICRSPYAERAFLRSLPQVLQESMIVASAGFIGPHRSPPREAEMVAAARGIDLSDHRAQLITPELVRGACLVVVMDASQRDRLRVSLRLDPRRIVVLGDLDPQPIETRTVRDPILQPAEVFSRTYDRIDRCIAELSYAITGEPVAVSPAGSTYDSSSARTVPAA
jgi:protein-tyrosine-phosphatase